MTGALAIRCLYQGRWLVGQLAAELGSSKRNTYRLLQSLELLGLTIEREREGNEVYYRIRRENVHEWLGLPPAKLHAEVVDLRQQLRESADRVAELDAITRCKYKGCKRVRVNSSHCEIHREQHNALIRRIAAQRRQEGMCPSCGKHSPSPGDSWCEHCQARHRETTRK